MEYRKPLQTPENKLFEAPENKVEPQIKPRPKAKKRPRKESPHGADNRK